MGKRLSTADKSYQGLIEYITTTLPRLPDKLIYELVEICGLTLKDAKTLVELDDGARLDFYDEVLECLGCSMLEMATLPKADKAMETHSARQQEFAITAANWCTTPMAVTF